MSTDQYEEDRFQRYRRKQLERKQVRVTGYVPEDKRDQALAYLKRLRAAGERS
ncbi:MAG: hypothetical protein JRJ45_00295 [Deltaproteobacteria bacterium]|nr:hypothetical protein [Deltaproteobacteria bacterium]